ncbi:dihydrofolate reductase family protein [Mucilaginibacter sp.]|uniref:dihydrofolate reductase family protein n=1 Tax=Mucilaginibacter sp. TaxID=1882438 RepID=UPI0025FAEA84|nr:dihydrofolate reductase family protein [Mucilaginibacter sp.]
MRKLRLQMQLSLDGFVAGPNGEMDWMTWNWGDDIKAYVNAITDPIDTILLGGHMPEGFVGHWKNVAANPEDEGNAFGKKMYDTHKVVFTKTMTESKWENTVLAKGDIVEEVNNLKNQQGSDIITYGGAGFASSLIKHNLIDEYQLFINPTIIGSGMAIFKDVAEKLNLKLVKATPFNCGVVALMYEK